MLSVFTLLEMVPVVFSFMCWVSTAVITVLLLQNSIDLRSGERNEVIPVQLEGAVI